MNEIMVENQTFASEATICAILPREDGLLMKPELRTHGAYWINYPKPGEEYALTKVPWKRDYADVGDYNPDKVAKGGLDKRKVETFSATQIADDLCKGINDNGPGEGSFFGVFVCAGAEPTGVELANARHRMEEYFLRTIAAADAQWSSIPRHDLISGVAKRAARYLNLDPETHPWLVSFRPTQDCPVCGDKIKPGVALCRSCGAILDEEKAAKFGIKREGPVAPTRRGRPKKEQPPQVI